MTPYDEMKFNKLLKIELAATKDAHREALLHPWLDTKSSQIVATDGRKIVTLPVQLDEGDTDGYITREALAAARKAKSADDSVHILAGTQLVIPNGATFPRPTNFRYPNWQQIMLRDLPERTVEIGFNAKYVYEMAQAMGCESVSLVLKGTHDPISVQPTGDNQTEPKAIGVLMPVVKSARSEARTFQLVPQKDPEIL